MGALGVITSTCICLLKLISQGMGPLGTLPEKSDTLCEVSTSTVPGSIFLKTRSAAAVQLKQTDAVTTPFRNSLAYLRVLIARIRRT